ncbi:MAG TPA: hypothetical protein VK196_04650 [Magnetospirillum sp.]|nr:hypothetical protein [Magnetospirillum sp.]
MADVMPDGDAVIHHEGTKDTKKREGNFFVPLRAFVPSWLTTLDAALVRMGEA